MVLRNNYNNFVGEQTVKVRFSSYCSIFFTFEHDNRHRIKMINLYELFNIVIVLILSIQVSLVCNCLDKFAKTAL